MYIKDMAKQDVFATCLSPHRIRYVSALPGICELRSNPSLFFFSRVSKRRFLLFHDRNASALREFKTASLIGGFFNGS